MSSMWYSTLLQKCPVPEIDLHVCVCIGSFKRHCGQFSEHSPQFRVSRSTLCSCSETISNHWTGLDELLVI